MAHHVDWIAEQPRRGWLSRILAPEPNGRPSISAFVVGTLAVAAFVVALTTQWQSVSLQQDGGNGPTPAPNPVTLGTAVTSADMLGLVYVLGIIVELAIAGAVVNRSDLALRLRFAVSAVSLGLIGVVVAVIKAVPGTLSVRLGAIMLPTELKVSYQPGLLFALASAILPAVAVWLAARIAARTARVAPATAETAEAAGSAEVGEFEEVAMVPSPRAWAVRPDEPLDLTVTPER